MQKVCFAGPFTEVKKNYKRIFWWYAWIQSH